MLRLISSLFQAKLANKNQKNAEKGKKIVRNVWFLKKFK